MPVTVHRLANLESLQSINIDTQAYNSDSSESADELSTRQRTKKHPHRGGVNQADVLSQICRETLEKTLTTLKNGIANETNAARRAEWTRKKKAVEMFGTELEGRLFEMSEMLDSNFVLGVKLRRAKREMLEMRSRLYHVRREREEVAVRMDDVRRRFADEEAVRIVSFSLFRSTWCLVDAQRIHMMLMIGSPARISIIPCIAWSLPWTVPVSSNNNNTRVIARLGWSIWCGPWPRKSARVGEEEGYWIRSKHLMRSWR